jgi:post-segregation antitoxin (ccd killing protein)
MQVTVTVPDELAAEAKVRGLAPEAYVEQLVSERVSVEISTTREERMANLEQFIEEMAAHSDKTPILPLEAFSRESIYQAHD